MRWITRSWSRRSDCSKPRSSTTNRPPGPLGAKSRKPPPPGCTGSTTNASIPRSETSHHSSTSRTTTIQHTATTNPPRPNKTLHRFQAGSLLRRGDKAGFVVQDMVDVDRFTPYRTEVPDGPVYLVHGLDRGDHLANYRPEEALPELAGAGRTPLLLSEDLHWALQQPSALERNRCFMTIGSRLRKESGSYDSRTPAVWISNGTGRDGRERRNAPKVGWCWWGNRHTWLGFASATRREAPAA